MKKLTHVLQKIVPPKIFAITDYYLRPQMGAVLGEPFNGQFHRQQLFLEIIHSLPIQAIVETGTFRGSTSRFLATESRLPVYTVETNPRFFHYAKLRLRDFGNVHQYLGDSRTILRKLASDESFPKKNVFFYLDAHWPKMLPLREEVQLISNTWHSSVIMIDDFQVPGDPGYRYDEYGSLGRICLEYLQPLSEFGLVPFFPSVPSSDETGLKMGCAVLTDSSFQKKLNQIPHLRQYQTSPELRPNHLHR
jgi:hypothetical protein